MDIPTSQKTWTPVAAPQLDSCQLKRPEHQGKVVNRLRYQSFDKLVPKRAERILGSRRPRLVAGGKGPGGMPGAACLERKGGGLLL